MIIFFQVSALQFEILPNVLIDDEGFDESRWMFDRPGARNDADLEEDDATRKRARRTSGTGPVSALNVAIRCWPFV